MLWNDAGLTRPGLMSFGCYNRVLIFQSASYLFWKNQPLRLFKDVIIVFTLSTACWVSKPGGQAVVLHTGFAQYEFLSIPFSTTRVATTGFCGLKLWGPGSEKVVLAWLKLKARSYTCLMLFFDPNLFRLCTTVAERSTRTMAIISPLHSHWCLLVS